jgi:hypothetical protein
VLLDGTRNQLPAKSASGWLLEDLWGHHRSSKDVCAFAIFPFRTNTSISAPGPKIPVATTLPLVNQP